MPVISEVSDGISSQYFFKAGGIVDQVTVDGTPVAYTETGSGTVTLGTVPDYGAIVGISYFEPFHSIGNASEDSPASDGDSGFVILGVRQDPDQALSANGNYSPITTDEYGRVKVSASLSDDIIVSGQLTALASTITVDCSRIGTLSVQLSGTYSLTAIFEVSNDDVTFVPIIGNSVGANSQASSVSTTNFSGIYRFGVSGIKTFRVRCSAYTSGTANVSVVSTSANSEPTPAVAAHGVTVTSSTPVLFSDTVTNLALNATFTGTSRDNGSTPVNRVFSTVAFADQAGTLRHEMSLDGTTWRRSSPDVAVTATSPGRLETPVVVRYNRVVYVNGGVATTAIQINSAYHKV